MSIWKRLFGPKQQETAKPNIEPDSNLTDAQILREYFSVKPEMKRSLRSFLHIACKNVGEKESRRITASVIRELTPGTSAAEALNASLSSEDGQRKGSWVAISIDWKAVEEINWQANEILHSLDISEEWTPAEPRGAGAVEKHLYAFGAWLAARGYQLLHIDPECDAYIAFVVHESLLQEALELASAAGVKAKSNQSFSSS